MRLSKLTTSVLALGLAGGMFLLVGPASGEGNPACDPVSGSGDTEVDPTEPGVFVGTGVLVIRGQQFDVGIVVTGGEPRIGDDGTMHVATSHTITYVDEGEESVLTTTDKAVLEPIPDGAPGAHHMNSNMKITSGTGIFAGVSGRLHGHGTIDMFDEVNNIAFPDFGEASYDINGVMCD